jgi:hypothetical protein
VTSGNLILNGVSEKQVAQILQFKVANEGKFSFNLTGSQPAPPPPGSAPGAVTYNNIILSWNSDANLKIILELVSALIA